MIAPLRQTDEQLDANQKLLARARRAVAESLLRDARSRPQKSLVSNWQSWLFAVWTMAMAIGAIGLLTGSWRLISY